MPQLPFSAILVAVLILCHVLPASTMYCDFSHANCIDGLAQSSSFISIDSFASSPLSFVYGFDAGESPQDGSSSIKVGYWLQYDADDLKGCVDETSAVNRTTELALRIANAPDFPGSISGHHHQHHHKCRSIWSPGDQCATSLKIYLQFTIYKLSTSGQPYESPLETALEQLMDPALGHYLPGCPWTLFQPGGIPAYPFVNETSFDGYSSDARIAEPGNPFCPWRTMYIPNTTAQQQARQWAVGIVTRGPPSGSEPLRGPEEVEVDLVCTRAPREFHIDEDAHDHYHDSDDNEPNNKNHNDEPYGPEPDYDGYPGDEVTDFGNGFDNHPDISRLGSFLGGRDIIDAFDFDTDYDYEDDEEESDGDCPSSGTLELSFSFARVSVFFHFWRFGLGTYPVFPWCTY